jgi:sugar lactone lactonase YvrE/predicted thioesterase
MGAEDKDFTLASAAGSCVVNDGTSCSVDIRFLPLAPGERRGAVVLRDSSNVVLGTQLVYGLGVGSLGVLLPGTITTIAGNGSWLFRGDNDLAKNSPIFLPDGVAVDGAGDVYLADTSNNRVRVVIGGVMKAVAGGGSGGPGDGGLAKFSTLNNPNGILLTGAGDLLIADTGNHAIRKVTLAGGVITTIAGQIGQAGSSGNGNAATSALLNSPESLALDAEGNLYISDTGNNEIRKVDAATGKISVVAGTGVAGFSGDSGPGTSGQLSAPWHIAMDSYGNLFIADLSNQRIRKLSKDGTLTTVAGVGGAGFTGDNGDARNASLHDPAGIAVDVGGNLYIGDSGNNRIRKVNAATGFITTIAGNGQTDFTGDDGPSTQAGIYGPYALTLDASGNLFFTDIFHHRIRELINTQTTLNFEPIRVGRTSAPQAVGFENDGNFPMSLINVVADPDSSVDTAHTTCVSSHPLAIAEPCVASVSFEPQTAGPSMNATVQIQSNAANSPASIKLSGEVDELEPTTTTVTSSANPSTLNTNVTFTAVVKVTSGAGQAPSGEVRFFVDGGQVSGTFTLNSASTATFTTSSLSLGTHSIKAAFTGDATNSPSTSGTLSQVVKQATSVALSSSANPSNVGASVTLTATVTGTATGPVVPATGTIVFKEGTTTLGSGTLNASGVATFPITSLAAGTHLITAYFAGDSSSLASNSPTLSQVVNKWSTTTTLTSTNSTPNTGESVQFSIAVAITSTTTAAGNVVLKDGTSELVTLTLDGSGHTTYSTSSLSVGSHTITASYQGDPTNAASVSADLPETVTKISTATTLSSSVNPANGGATIRLTATVSPSTTNANSGALSGTVSFKDGSTSLGTVSVGANGIATLDTSTLSVATHSITASYSGNASYDVSTSAALSQVVQLASTSVLLTSNTNPSIAGKGITLTAAVSSVGGIPTGTVTFFDGAVSIGTGTLNGSGQAFLPISTLSTGSHVLKATYGGDPKDEPSTSDPMTQVVQQATTGLTLTSSANPATAGVQVTFTAGLTSNGSIPSGVILLKEGSTTLGSATLSVTGSASFMLSNLSAGSHTLTASYAGDSDHAASISPALVQVIQQGTSSAVVLSSANPSVFGDSVTFTAKVTGTGTQPTGSVSFLDGSTALGTVAMDGAGQARFSTSTLAIGNHTITVTYVGDTTHSGSSPASIVQTVLQATSTTITSNLNPALVGDTIRLSAKVTGVSGSPVSGTVSFTDGAATVGTGTVSASGVAFADVSTLTAGSHLIVANYSGDSSNKSSTSSALSQVVNPAGTTVAITSNVNPSVVGNPVSFTATVTSTGRAPAGQVTFLDGSTVMGSATVASGVAVFITSGLTAGQHAVTARYGGDSGTQISTSNVLSQVAQQRTGLTISSNVNPALTAQPITLTATLANGANAGGLVTFLDGGALIGTAALNASGTASLPLTSLASGTHALSASYAGDSFNLSSTAPAISEVVQLRPSTVSMTASSDSYLNGQQVTLVAVVHVTGPVAPGGTVTFTSGGTSLGTVPVSSAGAATLSIFPTLPSYTIVATFNGDGAYSGSTASSYTIRSGTTTTFSLVADPGSVSITSGGHTTITLLLTSSRGFTDVLAMGCLQLPIDATCTFSQDKVTLAANGSVPLQLTFDTGHPLGAGPHASLSPIRPASVFQAGILLPAAALFGMLLFFARRKRRSLPVLLMLLMLVLTGFGVTGCGNTIDVSTTPAGSYMVRIMASGTQTGANQMVDLPVTVK